TWVSLLALGTLVGATGCKKKGGGAAADPSAQVPGGPPAGGNLVKNADFEDGSSLPWMSSFTPPAAGEAFVQAGAYCLRVDNAGSNPWDAQVRHREMVIQKGHTYTVYFRIWSDQPMKGRAKVGMSGPP